MTVVVGRVAMAVMGMILVEQLYRNTPAKQRWGIKYACLGIGGLFAYDFYLYSDAMLFRHVNSEIWAARGIVNALIVPLIAVSAARNPQWSLEISVSRRILFHSAALFGAAIYLLAMAAAGYYLRFFGGSWGTVLQAAFLFGAVILLMGVLFSGTLRSWLKVFISKHFFIYNYDYREEWLRFTRTLSEDGHGLGERTIQAVAELVESPGGALWISRESGNCEPVAHWNMPLASGFEPVNSSFCQFLENKQWVIDLQEYDSNPEKYGAICHSSMAAIHSQGMAGGSADSAREIVWLCGAGAAQEQNQIELGSERPAQNRRQPGGKLSCATGSGQCTHGGASV